MISVGDKLPSRIIEMIGSGSSLRLVIWLRHFGCRFYNEASLLLPDLQSRLAMSNIGLICIVQGTKEETELFWNLDGIPVIPDSLKESYRAMEFERTTFRKIFFAEKELKSRRAEVTKMGCAMNSKGTKAKSSDVL
ncbi:MAG: hypothetical protein PQJ50_07545, partial [Spirochaetales bacterium]|nr:hypothetical protein [Spirochaetales bacterium]